MKQVKKQKGDILQQVHAFESLVRQCDQVECPVRERLVGGQYLRECTMPAGIMVVSKMHKCEHPFFVTKGKVSVFTEGKGWELIEAPFTGITQPGTKRILYTHEDTIWTTVHRTDKETIEEVINEIIVNDKNIEQ
ncbi:hypothetical protein [Sphingobacterium detergens]|uniref:hypothetical protein n=1 Tax=Sphingobacterium detergens TaxID=1145106 RepID=UPI003AAC6027